MYYYVFGGEWKYYVYYKDSKKEKKKKKEEKEWFEEIFIVFVGFKSNIFFVS